VGRSHPYHLDFLSIKIISFHRIYKVGKLCFKAFS
jgi:hypothetical protein